jgi:hypothetical protein
MRINFRAAVFALAALAGAAHAADDTPAWLKELQGATLPAYPAKVNSVVLLNEEHHTAGDNGRLVTNTRTAIKVLNPQGRDVLFLDEYDTRSGKVRDFRAWMISPNGKVKKYGKDEIVDVACVDNDVYNECRKRAVSGKRDAEPGAIFAYESTIEFESFSNELAFHFQDASPVRTARLVVTLPAGWEIKSAIFNGAPAEAPPSGGAYTWQMENLPAIEREPSSPSMLSLTPWVGVTLLPPSGKHAAATWAGLSKTLTELNAGQAEPNDAIAAKARSLVEGATTELDKIRAIGKFTQQLNYVSIQVNLSKGGGYRPHAASESFQKLYGDCKDKANLTRAMLKAVGLTAYPVAIYSGDRTHVREDWASLGSFNHAISAIQVSASTQSPAILEHPKLGRLLFFDPTDPYVAPGFLPEHEQGSLALLGAGDDGGLVRVPANAALPAEHERQVDAVLNSTGTISGKFSETHRGGELGGAVSEYRGTPHDDFVKSVERWVGHSISGATSRGIEVHEGDGQFVLQGQFASDRFVQRPQNNMIVFKAGLLREGDYVFTEKTRKYPIMISTDALHETVRIELPKDFKVDELPDAVRLHSDFGNFDASWTAKDGTLVFQRTLEIQAQTVPAARYQELKKFLDRVSAAENAPVVLVK